MRPALLMTALLLSACNFYHPKEANAEPVPVGAPLDYAKVRAALFEPYCLRCHGASAAGGYSVETREKALTMVVPGDSANSILCQILQSGDMPPRGPMPSADVIELACDWIDEGAP